MAKGILSALEAASESVVMAEPSDLKSLAELHTRLEEVVEACGETEPVVLRAAQAAGVLVEAIILNDCNDPAAAMETVGEAVECMQYIVRDGRSESEVSFPARLGLRLDLGGAAEGEPSAAAEAPVAAPEAVAATVTTVSAPAQTEVTETPLQGDMSLMGEFISEAREHLENADVHLLTLETEPHNEEALNAVFRAFHTLKGVAGFLALEEILHVAHEAENLLDLARKGGIELKGGAIDASFEAVDMLKTLLNHVEAALGTGSLRSEPRVEHMMARLRVAAAGRLESEPVDPSEDTPLGEILVERGAATSDAVQWALETQSGPQEPRKVGDLLREASVVTGAQVAEALEMQGDNPDRGRVGEILVEVGAVRAGDVEKALEKQGAGPQKMGELLVRSGQAAAKEVAQALRSQSVGESTQVKDLVKVDADRLDRLVDLIGELVIAESMVSQATDMRLNISATSLRHINQVDKITRALQEMGTSLRMVPVRSTFQKMARLVRDVAKKAGKGVDFVTVGDDTELDKSVVDKIGDPLVHMIRNAVDHGLETPDERVRVGKPAVGRVELRAFHKGGGIYIEIEDDGRGLNREAIVAKAIERGLIRENDILSDREVWDLIFQPGFSTAKQITDVSGRGVGMDVVKRNIDALRGRVEVRSEWGQGTVISVRLPLTMAIIDGMVVGIGAERYVVPTLSIVRSIRPQPEQITSVAGRGELLNLDGSLLPIFRLSRIFSSDAAASDLMDGIIVVAENDGRQVGLAVDTLLGQQQIVIKPLGEGLKHAPGIVGGAVMPDGEVGLILDVAGLLSMASTEDKPSGAARALEAVE